MADGLKFQELLRQSGVERATIIGGGVIGASWAALFLANGLSVTINDSNPEISQKVRAVIQDALPALEGLGYPTNQIFDGLSFEADLATAVRTADLVQECGPERLDVKKQLWRTIEASAPKHALLLSSSSGIPASAQSSGMSEPQRLVIGHPFNPPHLMPLVEVVPSGVSDTGVVSRVLAFYRGLGKVALEVKKEVPGFVANRLQAALLRECIYLVREGVVSMRNLDDIVTNSLGIRWATNGPFLSFHLGGGTNGFSDFIAHFSKPMEALWASFQDVSYDKPTSALLIEQAQHFYGDRSVAELGQLRDAKEVAIIKALAATTDTSGT